MWLGIIFPFYVLSLTSNANQSINKATDEKFETTGTPTQNPKHNDYGTQHPNMGLLPSEDECGHYTSTNKIFGGKQTDIDEYPWAAMLLYIHYYTGKISNLCGGSLISPRYVLTAAHCIKSPDLKRIKCKLYRVRLGEWNLTAPIDCQTLGQNRICNEDGPQEMEIEQAIMHPNYNEHSAGVPYDIALIRLQNEVKFNDFTKPICLPFGDSGIYTQPLVVVGWGITEFNKGSNVLLQVALPVVDKEKCAKGLYGKANSKFIESQFCAGGEEGQDSCIGDSGGPLMNKKLIKPQTKWQLVGIVSYGPKWCGTKGAPGVYTKVSSFLTWILDNIKS